MTETTVKKKNRGNEKVERQLTSLEKDLLKALQKRLERARAVSADDPTEFMDMVSDSESDELAARIAEADSAKIDEIEDALRRLREGKYGVCQDCGEAISKKRLKVRPFATLCISCKQDREHEASGGSRNVSFGARNNAVADVGVGDRPSTGSSDGPLHENAESGGML